MKLFPAVFVQNLPFVLSVKNYLAKTKEILYASLRQEKKKGAKTIMKKFIFGAFAAAASMMTGIATAFACSVAGSGGSSGASDGGTATSGGGVMDILWTMLPFVIMIVLFYFLLIRPQKKREKQTKDMLAAIKVGDRITTIGGIFGRVCNIKDDVITIEVGQDKAKIVIARWAVRTVEGSDTESEITPG